MAMNSGKKKHLNILKQLWKPISTGFPSFNLVIIVILDFFKFVILYLLYENQLQKLNTCRKLLFIKWKLFGVIFFLFVSFKYNGHKVSSNFTWKLNLKTHAYYYDFPHVNIAWGVYCDVTLERPLATKTVTSSRCDSYSLQSVVESQEVNKPGGCWRGCKRQISHNWLAVQSGWT